MAACVEEMPQCELQFIFCDSGSILTSELVCQFSKGENSAVKIVPIRTITIGENSANKDYCHRLKLCQ